MSRLRVHRVLIGIALMLMAGGAWADFKKNYLDGVDAAKKGQWAEVRRLMTAAIAERPEPGRVRFYGSIPEPYVPHYYLGLANANLGDCPAAVSAFKNSASGALVATLSREKAEQARLQSNCEQQMLAQQAKPVEPPPTVVEPPPVTPPVAEPKPVVVAQNPPATDTRPPTTTPTAPTAVALTPARIAPAKSALAKVDSRIASIERQLKAAPLAGTGDARGLTRDLAALRAQRQKVAASLERARVGGDVKLLGSVEADAGKLDRDLGMLGERVQSAGVGLAQAQEATLLEKARQRSATLVAKIDQRLAEARDAGLADAGAVSAIGPPRTQLQQAVIGSDRAAIERALAAATAATTQLEAAIAAAPKPAPEPLRALAGWYLTAKYAEAASWNDVERLPDARSRAQALLLRGAARWHLWVRGGEQDGSLRALIDSDLREAKRLDRGLKPNQQAFSPKLVDRFAAL